MIITLHAHESISNIGFRYIDQCFINLLTLSTALIPNSLVITLQPADKKKFPYGGLNSGRPVTPPRGANQKKGKK